MMNFYNNSKYMDDVRFLCGQKYDWDKLKNKTIMISGATGMIGSFLIDVLMEKNLADGLNATIYALGRHEEKFRKRFNKYVNDTHLIFIQYDVQGPLIVHEIETVDYIFHLASNTHPMLYSTDPIGTILTNVIGLKNLLDFSLNHHIKRFVFVSSNEVYGENRGDVELFDEKYCGYIDCNTLRAGYPESKRCGEALCQAYKAQKDLDVVIPRVTRTYGPTMLMTDTKAASQFIKNGISKENIVLKSKGTQFYSYTYVSDAVSGLLTVLFRGVNGEAYNISDERGDVMLKDLAEIIAEIVNCKVVFELPDDTEFVGFSKVTKARLNGNKLKALGWNARYDIRAGIERTISILKENE